MITNSEINETRKIFSHPFLVSLLLTIILEILLSIQKRGRGIGNYVSLWKCIAICSMDIYEPYLEFYVSYYSPIHQQNNAINKINQLSYSNWPKGSCHYLFNPGNHNRFSIHTLCTLIKNVADKSKTFDIILNLAS